MDKQQMWLLTGGNGFLGSHIKNICLQQNFKTYSPNSSILNLLDIDQLEKSITSKKINHIIHCAGFVGGIQFYRENPYLSLSQNLLMGLNIIELCVKFDIPLTFISTGCIYSDVSSTLEEDKYMEGKLDNVTWPYGEAKRVLMRTIEAAYSQKKLDFNILVPANLYGPGDYYQDVRSHVIASLIKKFYLAKKKSQKTVEIWGSGRAERDFIYVKDFAEIVVSIVSRKSTLNTTLNVAMGQPIKISQLANNISEIINFKGNLKFNRSMPEGALKRSFSLKKFNNEFNNFQFTSLNDGLINAINDFKLRYEL